MHLKTPCPQCAKVLKCSIERIGSFVRCPACNHKFRVESAASGGSKGAEEASMEAMATVERAPEAPGVPNASADLLDKSSEVSSATGGRLRASVLAGQESLGKFGRYDLKQILGSGAFGIVYRAWDPQLSRQVAIKVPRFEITAQRKLRRFEQEARAAAKLQHPNIVVVLEEGIHEGKPFIVSEFVDGEPLSAKIRREPPDARQAAIWIRDLAKALSYAHQQGVVHRDIKPDNIMLGKHGRPQIMDFGLAKQIDEDSSLSIDGSIMGTPSYMSPEQARGETISVDGRSDQYSLGVVLYEMLAGIKPFSGTPHVVLAKVADLHTEPPSPRSIKPDVGSDLEAICLKAISKVPKDRYTSLSEMASDLDRWLLGKATLVRPLTLRERAIRWCRRNRSLALASSLSGAAVLLLAIISLSLLLRKPTATATVSPAAYAEESSSLRSQSVPSAEQTASPTALPTAQPISLALPPSTAGGWQGWPRGAPEPVIAPVDAATAKRLQQAWADYLSLPVERTISLPGGESLVMVFIPPGEFMMGSSAEERRKTLDEAAADPVTYPQFRDAYAGQLRYEHDALATVVSAPFYLAKTEVTQSQWAAILHGPENQASVDLSSYSRTLPATSISAVDADLALRKFSEPMVVKGEWLQLPAEKEWEHACRAGTSTRWFFGDDSSEADKYVWSLNNANNVVQEVAQLLPNAWGLHDMHGNALEWCANVHGNPSNLFDRVDVAPGQTLIRRGGSIWSTIRRNRAAGITTGGSTDTTSNAATQTTVRVMLALPRKETPADLLLHPPIEDYLRGRMELTVAKDGSGMFTSIQAALDAQKNGQIVRVLDRGPYRESIRWADKSDCALVSLVGTTVIDNGWESYEGGRKLANHMTNLSSARVHGFTWIAQDVAPEHVTVLRISRCSGMCFENCIVWSIPPTVSSWKTDVELHEPQLAASIPFCVRECQFAVSSTLRINRSLDPQSEQSEPLLITRNWLYYPSANSDDFEQGIDVEVKNAQQPFAFTFSHNIINRCSDQPGQIFNDLGLIAPKIIQNTVTAPRGFVMRSRNYASTTASLRGNLHLVESNTCFFDDDENEVYYAFAIQGWDVRQNQSNAEAFDRPGQLSLGAPQPKVLRLLSRDPNDRDFMRLEPQTVTVRAGDLSPGAVRFGNAPSDGDWLTRLQERWRSALLFLPLQDRAAWLEPIALPEIKSSGVAPASLVPASATVAK